MSIAALRWAYGLFELVDIPPAERCILLALCWEHTEKDGCFPSQERVSLLSGYRRRRVVDGLANLESLGLIRRETTRTKGKFQQTRYRLFGAAKGLPCADGGTRHRAHKKAHGDRAQTGAQYRGNIYTPDDDSGNVVPFSSQKLEGGRG